MLWQELRTLCLWQKQALWQHKRSYPIPSASCHLPCYLPAPGAPAWRGKEGTKPASLMSRVSHAMARHLCQAVLEGVSDPSGTWCKGP